MISTAKRTGARSAGSTSIHFEPTGLRGSTLPQLADQPSALGSVVALAMTTGRRRTGHGAELSIVTVCDGRIGDPVTWHDEPSPTLRRPRTAFAAVADDICAHLGNGPVVVHDFHKVAGRLDQLLPTWPPILVLNLRFPSGPFPTSAARGVVRLGSRRKFHVGRLSLRSSSASRALATAQLFMQITNIRTPGADCDDERLGSWCPPAVSHALRRTD